MHRILVQKHGAVSKGSLDDIKSSSTVWVDMTAPTDEELIELERHTQIEPTQVRAWLAGKKRPAALDLKKYSVITLLATLPENPKDKTLIATEPCVILISNDRNDFITIHGSSLPALEEIENYSQKHKENVFAGRATFLLFTFINELIGHYYEALDLINETVQRAESIALNPSPLKHVMKDILAAKKSMIYLHKALLANREVISAIEQEHLGFVDEAMTKEFRVLSSSITQLVEINSTYRDILNTSMEIHLAVISNNLNTTMKKVTSWAAIILIPSLIASIFGMNFENFRAFEWRYGVEVSFILMVSSVALLYLFFRKRDWL